MQRTTTAALAALLVIGALVAVPIAMAQQTETDQSNQTTGNGTVAPGAQLSGVVGVGEAELSGEIESRAYGIRIARANSSDAKAAVVAAQFNETDERLTELESRRAALETARENGSLSVGQYRARVATLHAESRSTARLASQTNETASQLPAAALEANGVDVTAVRTLSERAANLTGPGTAAIARSIAGENAGQPVQPAAGDRSSAGNARAGGNTTAADETSSPATPTADGSATDTTSGSDGGSARGTN
ncbi:hypothetical protein NDI56_12425 [Haloarcula sp. S1CR25-12]|uniref:DUF5667 domain-containing protein n=1 Tax=Haloarcula saliterrae TaxID=2950534 RepID=A0ABU2FD69_9EURY|nr:hypothetical protein [Haloarcula sp. S1CR25-12]MDS0260201.1 hypothetical protein [Haloarcula sp. S1CR25-12]